MRLTEKILKNFEETALFDDGFYLGNFEEYSERDLGEKITWEMMKKQILENQKIVDTLLTSYKHNYDNPGFPVGESASAYAKWIIKEATGKDIQEIQSQPKVENEK